MWAPALLPFTLASLITFPSSILCNISAAPTPNDSLSILTPNPPPISGKAFTFQWAGNRPNFTLELFNMKPTLLRRFSNLPNQSYTWSMVEISSGTEVYLILTDALSNSTYSGNFTIGSGGFDRPNTWTEGIVSIFRWWEFVLTLRCVYTPEVSSSAFTSWLTSIPTHTRTTGEVPIAEPTVSGPLSLPGSENTSSRGSSPRLMGGGAVAGICLAILTVIAAGIAHLFVSYRRGRYQFLGRMFSFCRFGMYPRLTSGM